MILSNDKYEVNIEVDKNYMAGNGTSRNYDYVYGLEKITDLYDKELDTTLSVTIDSCGRKTKIALTGEYYSFDTNCAVLEGDILTVLQNTTITQLDLRNFSRIFCKKIEECFFGFEIHKIADVYILYGETEIIKLDNKLNSVWVYSGQDIFVTKDNTPALIIGDDSIQLKDWQGNCYLIDFDGKEI